MKQREADLRAERDKWAEQAQRLALAPPAGAVPVRSDVRYARSPAGQVVPPTDPWQASRQAAPVPRDGAVLLLYEPYGGKRLFLA